MHPDLLDILSHKESPIDNQQLIDYLTGNMSDEENNAFEKSIMSSGIDEEALEGLQMLRNKEKIKLYQLEINKALREKLQHNKKVKRSRRKVFQLPYLIILTIALLALILLIWLTFHFIQANH